MSHRILRLKTMTRDAFPGIGMLVSRFRRDRGGQSLGVRLAGLAVVLVAYHAFLLLLRHDLGILAGSLAFLVSVYAGWAFGPWGGVLGAVFAVGSQFLHANANAADVWLELVLGGGSAVAVGALTGSLWRTYRRLKVSEANFRHLAEGIEEVFWLYDLDLQRTAYVSPSIERTWGQSAESVSTFDGFLRTVHPDDLERVADLASGLDEHGLLAEYRVLRPTGEIRWVQTRAKVSSTREGCFIVGLSWDVTDRKRLEDEAAKRQEALARAERLNALGTIVAGVAHEVNNPLAYIQGNIELTQMSLADVTEKTVDPDVLLATQQAEEQLAVALQGVKRIGDIVQGLKQVARPDTGLATPTDVNALLRNVVQIVRTKVKGAVQVDLESPALPPLVTNPTQLAQAVLNLALNGADAAAETQHGHVQVAAAVDHREVLISVTDNGRGIPEDFQPRIFIPFNTTKPEGTGLGLSIAHAFAQSQGGSLTFSTRRGEGTTFLLRLPLERPREVPVLAAVKAGGEAGGSRMGSR